MFELIVLIILVSKTFPQELMESKTKPEGASTLNADDALCLLDF